MKQTILLLLTTLFALTAPAQIDSNPCDAEAIAAAKNLYAYLRDEVWGKKVLSGCQARWNYNTDDAETIYQKTGKYPAVNVFDFQHYDMSWVNYRSAVARDWYRNGGIVSFMWHWNVPVNAFTAANRDAYTVMISSGDELTYFSPSRAVTEGTLENRIARQQLDGVAALLLLYQSQGIPVLWRPLHEAAGNRLDDGTRQPWFWWGSEGAEAYKRLYRYMYDYFQKKGLHNLLWIWTSQTDDPDWYPGDDCVDFIARDAYEKNSSHAAIKADFDALKKRYPNKMLILAETDGVPSYANMEKDEAKWLFVAPWTGDFPFNEAYGNTDAFWKTFMTDQGIITRDQVTVKT